MKKTASILALLALTGGLAACSEKSEPQFDDTAPAAAGRAVSEIPALKVELDDALSAYEAGRTAAALDGVRRAADTGFPVVQGPLSETDPALAASIERLLSARIPDAFRAGAANERAAALVGQAQAELDRAAAELRRAG